MKDRKDNDEDNMKDIENGDALHKMITPTRLAHNGVNTVDTVSMDNDV